MYCPRRLMCVPTLPWRKSTCSTTDTDDDDDDAVGDGQI